MLSFIQSLTKIDAYAAANPFPEAPRDLYEPCAYMLDLGGKRLRPALLLMAAELFADAIDMALPAAWAVELFHNFTLMHDDIMDAAPLRRGQPTVHTRWNTTTGILSGDVMLIHAYRYLTSFPDPAVVTELVKTFSRVATEVCEGQQYDINFESRNDVALPEYIRMIELKTAVLLGGAMEMGAICAGAKPADAEHLYHFGRLAGIAFQIQDDLLDTYGDPAKFGKQVGGDILQNKKTFLVLKALETMPAENRRTLETWLQTGPEAPGKVEAVRAIFDQYNIPELAAAEKKHFQTEAFAQLEKVDVPEARKVALREMIVSLLDRDR